MNPENEETLNERITGYFAGTLTGEEHARLIAWLESDPSHKQRFDEAAEWWAIAHVPQFERRRESNFKTHIREKLVPRARAAVSLRTFGWSAAAAVLLCFLVSTYAYKTGLEKGGRTGALPAFCEVSAPLGAQARILLPDRTQVWLNAGSTVQYARSFGTDKREVSLTGEAYFEVAHDSLHPFRVRSGGVGVRVLGTKFNLKAYPEESGIDISLKEGKVEVALPAAGRSETVVLSPGRELLYDKRTGSARVRKTDPNEASAWVNGELRFTDKPFGEIARALERRFDVHIRIKSERLRNEVYTGSFLSTHTLNEILEEINVDNDYRWHRKGNEISITDR